MANFEGAVSLTENKAGVPTIADAEGNFGHDNVREFL